MHSMCTNNAVTPQTDRGVKMKEKKKMSGGLTSMVSAMIPGAKMDNKGRVSVDIGTSSDTITFNIGGTIFETYRSTLFRIPNSPLANDKFLQKHYRPERKDFFFDRDPDIFRATLNYLRTGELHIPSFICGPAAKTELEFWGVVPSRIERCCWTNYNNWNCTLAALDQLDNDRKSGHMATDETGNRQRSWWRVYQPTIWNFLSNPDSSFGAKIYGLLTLALIFLSIFTFVAGTTKYFESFEEISSTSEFGRDDDAKHDFNSTDPVFNVTSSQREVTIIRKRHDVLAVIDFVCLVFFTMEYLVRLICTPKKLTFITSILNIIDLFAILPEYIEMMVYATRPAALMKANSFDVTSCFKITRVLRIFRLIKHVPGLWIFVYTLKSSLGELFLLICFMMVGILFFSSLIYFAEDRSNFESIPASFWWAIITMTTVGYGDMYPETVAGKLIGSFCAMSGLLMIGFSVPALVNNFLMFYKHMQFSMHAERESSPDAKPNDSSDMNKLVEDVGKADYKQRLAENEALMSEENGR